MDIIKEYTVSEIVKDLKNTIEGKYFYIKLKGEITGFKKHPSGHLYFSLKDDSAMINVVMFKSYAEFCNIDLQDGLEVILSGKLTIYKERSNYQLLAETAQISGVGALLKIIEERKKKFEKEGLFNIERKKPIPKLPKSMGLITAESGAAIHDILSRLKNRTPISIFLYSVLMQGKNSSKEIIEAINYFNSLSNDKQPQVLVITRGGGSVEDLMSFNDEDLVRAVANSKIPIISAIGHEIDWTLIDYASDLRLPTPTSVAEYLTISKEQAYINLNYLIVRLYKIVLKNNIKKAESLKNIFFNFLFNKTNRFNNTLNNINYIEIKLNNFFKIIVQKYKNNKILLSKIDINKLIKNILIKLNIRMNLYNLKLYNFEKKYPILKDNSGKVIKYKKELIENEEYTLNFVDGDVKIKIIKI